MEEKAAESGGITAHKFAPVDAVTMGGMMGKSQIAVILSIECSCSIILDSRLILTKAITYIKSGMPRQESSESTTVIQNIVCIRYKKPSGTGFEICDNIVTIVAIPVGIVPLQL